MQMWSHVAERMSRKYEPGNEGKPIPRLHHWDSQLLKQTGLKSTGLQISPMKCILELGENTDLWSLVPHWFKMMLQELSLLNVQVAHVWGPSGFPQQQPGILAAGSKRYPCRPKSREMLSGLICTKLVKAKCSGTVSAPVGGTAIVWSNVQELYKMCLLCTHFFFFFGKDGNSSISDLKPATLNPNHTPHPLEKYHHSAFSHSHFWPQRAYVT